MRNRAKCKKCNSIIESYHQYDYVSCKCEEISISGGNYSLDCSAKNWANFLRVDDEGNEIVVTVKDKDEPIAQAKGKPNRQELIDMLEEMIKGYERLPEYAKQSPISHYDFLSALLLLSEILRADE